MSDEHQPSAAEALQQQVAELTSELSACKGMADCDSQDSRNASDCVAEMWQRLEACQRQLAEANKQSHKLAASEMRGLVNGWQKRAEAAERERDELRKSFHAVLDKAGVRSEANQRENEALDLSPIQRVQCLIAERDELRETGRSAEWFINSRGYQRCDIAACNCGMWHGGHAEQRLAELRQILGENGTTILESVEKLIAANDELRAELAAVKPRVLSLIDEFPKSDGSLIVAFTPDGRIAWAGIPWANQWGEPGFRYLSYGIPKWPTNTQAGEGKGEA